MKLSEYIEKISSRKPRTNAKIYPLIAIRGSIGEVLMQWKYCLDNGGTVSAYSRSVLVDKLGDVFREFCLEHGPLDDGKTVADIENYMLSDVEDMKAIQRARLTPLIFSNDVSPHVGFALLALFEAVSDMKTHGRTFFIVYLAVLSTLNITLVEVVEANLKKA